MFVPKQVFAVGKVAATETGRYAITGVQLERTPDGRPIAVATDGKRMIAATWKEDAAKDFPDFSVPGQDIGQDGVIVPSSLWNDIAKGIPKRAVRREHKFAQVQVHGQEVQAATTDGGGVKRTGAPKDEGVFPKFRQVIPKGHKKAYITFNARYLAEVALAVAEAAGPRSDGKDTLVTLAIEAPNRPALIVTRGEDAAVLGVLMPCRDEDAKGSDEEKYVDGLIAEFTGGEIAKALAEKAKRRAKVEAEACCDEQEPVPCAECSPVAHVNEVVAEAFGMKGMPNVEVHEEEPASPEEADLLRKLAEQQQKLEAMAKANEELKTKVQHVNRIKRLRKE